MKSVPQLQLPILALRIQAGNLNINRNLRLHSLDILVLQQPDALRTISDADDRFDAGALVVAEAVLLHDALDEFGHGEVAQEDGPVVDLGFGGADVDAEGWKETTNQRKTVE